jgi:hypothetical protein
MDCSFPLCKRIAQPNGYCIQHGLYASSPVENKKKTAINKVSEKMKGVKAELKKLYPLFLKVHPKCEINSPECTGTATCIHHTEGRGKNEVQNQGTWKASCTRCNGYVEDHHAWAEERGFKKSRHKKKQ